MKLIECKLGAAEPMVAGRPYNFSRDRFGRFVCRVISEEHAAILLSVEHYREVPEEPAPAEPPAAQPAPTPLPTDPPAFVDDIGLIKGIGPMVRVKLDGKGINSLAQIAAWTPADVESVDAELGLKGSIARMGWVEQAKALLPAPVEPPAAQPAE